MKYTKPPLSYDKQADILIKRGLQADKDALIKRLQSVNYYRLSGYLYPFRKKDDSFRKDTSLAMIWGNYCFDRQLRLLIMDACERFESALKTDVVYYLAHHCGAFGYLDSKNLPGISSDQHKKLLDKIKEETDRSKEIFVKHFFHKYGDNHSYLPLWMTAEVLSFGSLHTMYRGLSPGLKQKIAMKYRITDKVLLSWVGTIQVIRNICAHHGRLYNRILGVKPLIPNKDPLWHTPRTIDNSRIFSVLSILNYLLKIIEPKTEWEQRVIDLVQYNNKIPSSVMGFYPEWKKNGLWKGAE